MSGPGPSSGGSDDESWPSGEDDGRGTRQRQTIHDPNDPNPKLASPPRNPLASRRRPQVAEGAAGPGGRGQQRMERQKRPFRADFDAASRHFSGETRPEKGRVAMYHEWKNAKAPEWRRGSSDWKSGSSGSLSAWKERPEGEAAAGESGGESPRALRPTSPKGGRPAVSKLVSRTPVPYKRAQNREQNGRAASSDSESEAPQDAAPRK